MKSANSRLLKFFGSCAATIIVGGCAVGGVPIFKKTEKTEEALPDVHPIRKERATAAAKKFDSERNRAEYLGAAAEWRQGNFKGCRDGLDKILHRDPEHRDSLILLAELELEQDRAENAVEVLRRGVAAHPKDGEMAYKLGLALESAGEESEALHHFHTAVQLAPQEKKYAEVFKHAEEHARQAGNSKREDVARPDAITASDRPASEPVIQLTSSETELELPPDAPTATASDNGPETAVSENTASQDEAGQSEASVERPISADRPAIEKAAADWDAGRKGECAKTIAKILEREPKHIEANILQVELDLDAGRHDEARARIERLAIRNPQNAQVRRACAIAYETLGDTARAAAAFAAAEALELGAIEDATPRSQLARDEAIRTVSASASVPQRQSVPQPQAAPSESSQPRSSIAVRDEAPAPSILAVAASSPALPILDAETEAQAPTTKAKLNAQQLVDKGEVFLKAGRFDDAERELTAAISSNSCVVKTASAAAVAPLKYEQSALALKLAQAGLKKFPDSAGLHRIEGTAALRLGRHLEAEAALRQSLSLDNSQALTYFLLGSVYDRLGNQEAADRHLRQAARLDRRYASRK